MKGKRNNYTIRPARFDDAVTIFKMIRSFQRELVPRPIADIVQNIDRFFVCETDGEIIGSVSWQILPEIGKPESPVIEIKSLAVEAAHQKKGAGQALVKATIRRIRKLKPSQIIALTFTPEFFEKLGFTRIPKQGLMHKIYVGCANCTRYDSPFTCPEIAVAINLDSHIQ